MSYKRLEQGRFPPQIFLRQGLGFRSMRWDELLLLMEGLSPKVARRKRYQSAVAEVTSADRESGRGIKNKEQKVWLSR